MWKSILAMCAMVLVLGQGHAETRESFRPGEIWPDDNGVHINAHGGGMYAEDGVTYWFGEHKISGRRGNSAQVGVRCYASRDLYNWEDRGIALRVVEDDPDHEIAKGCILERPKVIRNAKTGKYVMWFHLELKGQRYDAARTGLAVADKVTGPYRFVKSLRPNAGKWPENMTREEIAKAKELSKELLGVKGDPRKKPGDGAVLARDFSGGQMSRDMTLFVDDDGKAYHLHASEENQTLHISLLTDDYLDFAGPYARVFPGRYMEAPAIFKHKGKYTFIGSGCTGWAPNAARSAVADNIMGPWRELGNPCRGTEEENSVTFDSQSTYVLPVEGKQDAFIFMADRWSPRNPIDGRYIWLPIEFDADGKPTVRWRDAWDLSVFGSKK